MTKSSMEFIKYIEMITICENHRYCLDIFKTILFEQTMKIKTDIGLCSVLPPFVIILHH